MARLVTFDEYGEPWLDNPMLITVNTPKRSHRKKTSKKGRKHMAHRKGRMPAGLRRYWATHRRKKGRKHSSHRRKRRHTSVAINRPRKRHHRINRRRHHGYHRSYKRHYKINRSRSRSLSVMGHEIKLPMGLALPGLQDIAFGALGYVAPPMITTQVMNLVPASWMTGSMGTAIQWLVKVVSVVVPGYLIKKYYNVRAGYAFLIGGAASLAIDALRTFFPSVASMVGLGYQPLLGFYPGGQLAAYFEPQSNVRAMVPAATRGLPRASGTILSGTPERLDPSGRF